MKRTFLIAMVAAALVLSACSGLSPKADPGGKPASFPAGSEVVPSGDETSVEAVVDKVPDAMDYLSKATGPAAAFEKPSRDTHVSRFRSWHRR